MRTFIAHHKSPIKEYDYLAVDTGSRPPPAVMLWNGRQCYVTGTARVNRVSQRRSTYTALFLRFLDDDFILRVTATEFNKKAKTAPLVETPPAHVLTS